MSDSFLEKSREIADNFIQSILFIDDEIYSSRQDKANSLETESLIKAFSKAKKLCALNNPKSENDFDNIIEIAKKADITVLDWRIIFNEDEIPPNEEEADVDEDDPRGKFTLKLLNQIFSDPESGAGTLKLILIYTGETALNNIVETITKSLEKFGLTKLEENIIGKENVKIIVAGKPTLEERLKHSPELKEWILQYDQIPEFLITEFTKMTAGLISNVALGAISSIRNNSYKMLEIYNRNLDPAFLSHRSMLPIPEDADDLLLESISHSFKAMMEYSNIQEICNNEQIANWIDNYTFTDKKISIAKNKEISILSKELIMWQKLGFENALIKIWHKQFPKIDIDKNKILTKYKDLHKSPDEYFLPNEFGKPYFHEDFSILTHHKSNFINPSHIPKLTLGTLVKGKKSNLFWLCIQQKCDSVRIPKTQARRFLFLPLSEIQEGKNFNIIVKSENDYIKLKIDFGTFSLRTIKFNSTKNGMVYARKYGASSDLIFTPVYNTKHKNYSKDEDENFKWILDLKDSQAQRVANTYANGVSRVALDESEWLRRWSGQ